MVTGTKKLHILCMIKNMLNQKRYYSKSISNNPSVSIIFLTFNRFYYTKETLPALLNSSQYPFKVRIVDNGSTDETVVFLKNLNHPNIEKIIFNKKNEGLVKPTKQFWKETDAELIGKIDNDILVPQKWIDNLVIAHKSIPQLGVMGYCHFREEDINHEKVALKMEEINGIKFRRQPWIGGNYLMKKSTVIDNKGYKKSRKFFKNRILYGFNKYQEKLAKSGFIHGYLCNSQKLLYTWDHIDDPRHPLFFKNKEYYKIRNMTEDDIVKWFKRDAKELLQ